MCNLRYPAQQIHCKINTNIYFAKQTYFMSVCVGGGRKIRPCLLIKYVFVLYTMFLLLYCYIICALGKVKRRRVSNKLTFLER